MFSTATKVAAGVTEASAENDIRSKISSTVSSAERKLHNLADDVSDRAHDAGAKARHYAEKAQDQIKTVADRVNTEVHGNPLRSALITLGVGFVLGMLLSGSRRSY